uniref:Uncharacterized protein n=1 Tax=Hyaloperonospora arabidopsidis (strain Emoy2) TaxID=559515 RepID=M4C347_HYAAE
MVVQVEVGPPLCTASHFPTLELLSKSALPLSEEDTRERKAMSEKTSESSVEYVHPRLVHLESVLQELATSEEYQRQRSIELSSFNTRQKVLSAELQQTQEALAAAQASKAALCEEIGALRQTKADQVKQLERFKADLQSARELRAVMTKKMEDLETSTWTVKQQYIRSLASRIKTSARVLQQLDVTSGTSFSTLVAGTSTEEEQVKPTKRKRVEKESDGQLEDAHGQPKLIGSAATHELCVKRDGKMSEVQGPESTTTAASHEDILAERLDASPKKSSSLLDCDKQCKTNAESETTVMELRAQITDLKSEFSVLDGKYSALVREHDEVLAERSTTAQDIKAKESKIEELTLMLETSRSKPQDFASDTISARGKSKDKEATEGQLKMLEESLTQMNAYADQLEMVIAQCPSCTIKLQNESTQDSVANRAE